MKISHLVVLFVLSACSTLRAGEESASETISPVYEQMVGRKAALLQSELIRKNKIRQEEPFYLIDWAHGKLASRMSSDWSVRSCPPCEVKQGIIFFDAATGDRKALGHAARFLKQMDAGFLMVFHAEADQSKPWSQVFTEEGLKVVEDIRESELEFLKNASGRQAIDLSDPKVIQPIYERLVHGGLNPVQAWPLAEEAIRHFRSSNSRILIAGRPENS